MRVSFTRRQHARPAHKKWHMRTPFKKGQFPAAKRLVDIWQANIIRSAIITGENNERVFIHAIILERLQNLANTAVEGSDHCRIDALTMVRNFLS